MRRMRTTVTLLLLCFTFFGCGGKMTEPPEQEVEIIIVRVPPYPNPNYSRFQNWLLFHRFLFPSTLDGSRPIEEYAGHDALPHDDSLIHLTLDGNGQIFINNVPRADDAAATAVLAEVFEVRTKMGVFEPESDRIVKAVGIRVPLSAKYSDLVRMARIAKDSGADPVVLLLDGHLPQQIQSIP
jgi:hypothetical protein